MIFEPGLPGVQFLFYIVTLDGDAVLGSAPLPQHVDPASSLGQTMSEVAAELESYNSGALTTEAPDGTCQ
jgi:hypothetical protein